jgi:hypothetical protein
VLQLLDRTYFFGRVVSIDAQWTGSVPPGSTVLIYVYDLASATAELPNGEDLRPDRLLLLPMFTNRLPWSRGYFENIANVPLTSKDVLPQHCFRSPRGHYFDEHAHELPEVVEPCGRQALHSYDSIGHEVTGALGIARKRDQT